MLKGRRGSSSLKGLVTAEGCLVLAKQGPIISYASCRSPVVDKLRKTSFFITSKYTMFYIIQGEHHSINIVSCVFPKVGHIK